MCLEVRRDSWIISSCNVLYINNSSLFQEVIVCMVNIVHDNLSLKCYSTIIVYDRIDVIAIIEVARKRDKVNKHTTSVFSVTCMMILFVSFQIQNRFIRFTFNIK